MTLSGKHVLVLGLGESGLAMARQSLSTTLRNTSSERAGMVYLLGVTKAVPITGPAAGAPRAATALPGPPAAAVLAYMTGGGALRITLMFLGASMRHNSRSTLHAAGSLRMRGKLLNRGSPVGREPD